MNIKIEIVSKAIEKSNKNQTKILKINIENNKTHWVDSIAEQG